MARPGRSPLAGASGVCRSGGPGRGHARWSAPGRYAEGVIHSGWFVAELLEQDMASVRRKLASRTSPRPFDICFNSAVSINHDESLAYEWARPYAARAFIDHSSPRVPGWSEEDRLALREQYDYYDHFSPRNNAVRSVPDHLISKKVAVGRPADVLRQLELWRRPATTKPRSTDRLWWVGLFDFGVEVGGRAGSGGGCWGA